MSQRLAFTQRNRETRELEYVEIMTHPPQSKIIVDAKESREGDVDITLSDPNGSRTVTADRNCIKLIRDLADELLDVMPRSEHDVLVDDRIFLTIENYSDLNWMELAMGMNIDFGSFRGQLLESIAIIPRGRVKLVYSADGWRRERLIR